MSRQITMLVLAQMLWVPFFASSAKALPVVNSASVTLHYDASTLGLANGDGVSSWTAATGPAATPETADVTPTFETNWSPTGLSGVVFDGVDDRLIIGGGGATGISGDAIFAVFKMNGTGFPEQQQIIGGNGTGGGQKIMGVRAGQLFVVDQPAGVSFSDTEDLHVVSWVTGTNIRIDGSEPTGDTIRTILFSDISMIGDERESPPDNPGPNMTIGEIIVFEGVGGAMSASDQIAVENYLSAKWVPEPSTLIILSMGSLFLLLRRRSRK